MKIATNALIDDLTMRVNDLVNLVETLREKESVQWNYKPDADSWSAWECLEHLNLYGDFYLPEIERAILTTGFSAQVHFRPGLLGNYFANLMLPGAEGQRKKKMSAPKDKRPCLSGLSSTTTDRFLKQQERIVSLLEMARNTDLTRTKTAISLSPWIRLRLGDTFRFYVYHLQRHVVQAEKALLASEKAQAA